MFCMKKSVANNTLCAYMFMVAVGAAAGFVAAKITVDHCKRAESISGKAKKAFKNIEEKFTG